MSDLDPDRDPAAARPGVDEARSAPAGPSGNDRAPGDASASQAPPEAAASEDTAAGEGATTPPRASDSGGGAGSVGAFFRELPVLLLVAFVLAFLLRTFVVQVFYIPSSSMEPTLQVHDRMIVEKITYRFREPRRGEVVVFEGEEGPPEPANESWITKVARGAGQFLGVVPANARDFVKRVIGLPGDRIVIREGVVYVNGTKLDEPYVVNEDTRSQGPYVVPEGKLFFLGDNRPNSSDSRFPRLGYVDESKLVGRAIAIIWPPSHMGALRKAEYADIPPPDQAPAEEEPSASATAESSAPAPVEQRPAA